MQTKNQTTPNRLRLLACMVYEGMLLFGLVFIAAYLFDFLTDSRHVLKLRAARQIFLFLLISLYFLSAWKKSGQTLAMKTWRIRLTAKTGGNLNLLRLFLRYLLMWVFPLITAIIIEIMANKTQIAAIRTLIFLAPFSNFIYTWLDKEKQFLHDRLCHTRLVNS